MTRCSKCSAAMEQGFLVDRGAYGSEEQATWASGAPDKSFWRASAVGSAERMLALTTWRCTQCGYLEFFAPNAT